MADVTTGKVPGAAGGQERPLERMIHPGSGRRKAPLFNKGRQLEPEALDQVRSLLGERPRRRDLLIEHLHLIQDRFGCLHARHLQALAEEMALPMAAVFEVASFYAHFDVVLDGESPPPPLTVRVCDSLTCEMMGAERILAELPSMVGADVRIVRAPCMGRCDAAPVAEVGRRHIDAATAGALAEAVRSGKTDTVVPVYEDFDSYRAKGGYEMLRACYAGERSPESIIETIEASGLRGLGGAGFKSGLKWRLVREQPKPRLMAINGDEGEPGTVKDRFCLEGEPHRFLEGMLIAGWAADCDAIYVYIRDEYPAALKILEREISRLRAEGLDGGRKIELRRGAGAYICGEESAMLESIEGKRGLPRHKPPYPTERGLFGRPTLIHNVETVFWVRQLLEEGPESFSGHGRHGRKGLRAFSVSGRVREPGVKLAPAGITAAELIEEYCGGMQEGHRFKGYLPGGASGGILPAHMANIPLDFDTLQEFGCFIGSAAIVVLSDHDDMKRVALNLMRFFEDESCGQCTPCRNGTEKAVKLMETGRWNDALLRDLSAVMMDASICGLGQAAPNPLLSVLKHFPEDL